MALFFSSLNLFSPSFLSLVDTKKEKAKNSANPDEVQTSESFLFLSFFFFSSFFSRSLWWTPPKFPDPSRDESPQGNKKKKKKKKKKRGIRLRASLDALPLSSFLEISLELSIFYKRRKRKKSFWLALDKTSQRMWKEEKVNFFFILRYTLLLILFSFFFFLSEESSQPSLASQKSERVFPCLFSLSFPLFICKFEVLVDVFFFQEKKTFSLWYL